MQAQTVLDFWFDPQSVRLWFEQSDDFDQRIRTEFLSTHERAKQGELWGWRGDLGRSNAEGYLAEIIVLDQFSRNLYRNSPQAFAQDPMALTLAQEAITLQLDQQLDPVQRKFLYMPFMHSESRYIHEFAYKLFQRLGDDITLDFEKRHKDIIDQFGRYPHRNQVLGRTSTLEEIEFLKQPNSSF